MTEALSAARRISPSRIRAAGLAITDTPHSTFHTDSSPATLYTLPFGKGQAMLNRGGVVNQLAGGWQLSVIAPRKAARRSIPFVGLTGDGFSVSNRLNCVSGVDLHSQSDFTWMVQPRSVYQHGSASVRKLRAQTTWLAHRR